MRTRQYRGKCQELAADTANYLPGAVAWTMDGFRDPTSVITSRFSASGTFNWSSVLERFSATAPKASSVTPRPLCAVAMSIPVYLQGPPTFTQMNADSLALYAFVFSGLEAACANHLFTRLSARIRSTKPLATASTAGCPPKRS